MAHSLWGGVSSWWLVSDWSWEWGDWSDELGELRVSNALITVSVDSSNDGHEFHLRSIVTVLSEERSKVGGGDSASVVSVNRSEGGEWRVVVLDLHLSLEDLEFSGGRSPSR